MNLVRKNILKTSLIAMAIGVCAFFTSTDSQAKVTVSSIKLKAPSGTVAYVAKGKKIKLTTTVSAKPNTAANKKVTYKTSNKKIAVVNTTGYVKGKKAGSATITATSVKNKKVVGKIKVYVKKSAVSSVKLSSSTLTISKGGTKELKATVTASSSAYKNIKWSTSNKAICKVSNGVLTAVKEGTATITVKSLDGSEKSAKCKVTVTPAIAAVEVVDESTVKVTLTSKKELKEGDFKVKSKLTPKGSYNYDNMVSGISTTDEITYFVKLISPVKEDSYIKVSVSSIAASTTYYINSISRKVMPTSREVYVTSFTKDTKKKCKITPKDIVGTTGKITFSITGLPSGINYYFDSDKQDIILYGKISTILDDQKAVVSIKDEMNKKYTLNIHFFGGDEKTIVGCANDITRLTYHPENEVTAGITEIESGYNISKYCNDKGVVTEKFFEGYFSGGSGNYTYEVTGLPKELGTIEEKDGENIFVPYLNSKGKRVNTPAGTYDITLKVKDKNDSNIFTTKQFKLTLDEGQEMTGVVTDREGRPVEKAYIELSNAEDYSKDIKKCEAVSSHAGEYYLRFLPGKYFGKVHAGNYSANIINNKELKGTTVENIVTNTCRVEIIPKSTEVDTYFAAGNYKQTGYSFVHYDLPFWSLIMKNESVSNVALGIKEGAFYYYANVVPGQYSFDNFTEVPGYKDDKLVGTYTLSGTYTINTSCIIYPIAKKAN